MDSLPPDWTHLQFDVRIEEEDRYVELAPIVAQVNAWPLSKDDWHWRFNTMRAFGHAAAPETVRGTLETLDGLGIHGELRHAGYIDTWISLLKTDNRAIFTAASKASQAADYIRAF